MAKPSERIASLDYLLSAADLPAPGLTSSANVTPTQQQTWNRSSFQPAQGSLVQGAPACTFGAFQPMQGSYNAVLSLNGRNRQLGSPPALSWSQQGLKKAPVVSMFYSDFLLQR